MPLALLADVIADVLPSTPNAAQGATLAAGGMMMVQGVLTWLTQRDKLKADRETQRDKLQYDVGTVKMQADIETLKVRADVCEADRVRQAADLKSAAQDRAELTRQLNDLQAQLRTATTPSGKFPIQ